MSKTAALAAPTPQSPVEGAVVPLDAATFRWTAPPGSSSFDLRIASAAAPDAPVVEIEGVPSTETTLADALPAADLVWWVRREGGAWSAPSSFRAGTLADLEVVQKQEALEAERERALVKTSDPAVLEAPPAPVWPHAQGDALEGAPDLDWSAVPGFDAPDRADLPLADAEAPSPVAPLGGEIVDAAAISLRWSALEGADGYDVELSPHPAFDRDVFALEAGQATEVALPGLVPAVGRKLLWRVRARTGNEATPWSRYGRFYPAGNADVDQFRAGLDAALTAQRRGRDHAAIVRQRELDLLPLHQTDDPAVDQATFTVVIGMMLSGIVIALLVTVFSLIFL
ncbi:fibronectin type III domain-containing protein [Rubrivirga sp.]|uniref:fibronectin type III domain-containing protein n=1 Tax=Rubrivirga sp. TaxID=1885344 RepID=UPI003C75415A